MDLATHSPRTAACNDALFVVVDCRSKQPMPTTNAAAAKDIAQLYAVHTCQPHGRPRFIVSDGDSRFIGRFYKALFKCTERG